MSGPTVATVSHTLYTPRVAIITGAAQGIGREIALRLAGDGLDVAVNDIPSKSSLLEGLVEEIKAKGRESIFVTGDVSSEEDVKSIIDTTVEKLGSVDVVSQMKPKNIECIVHVSFSR